MMSVKNQSAKGAKWVVVEKFSNQGVNFLFGIFMARLLAPEDFGVLSMINIVIHITSIFIDSGFSTALIRLQHQTEKDYSTVFYFNIFISLLAYSFIFLFSENFASFFKMPILDEIIRVQSICLIINSFASVQTTRLTINLNFKSLAIISLVSSLFSGTFAIILALKDVGVWALVWQGLLFSIFNLFLVSFYSRWIPSAGFSMDSFRKLGGFGIKILGSSLIHTIYIEMSSLLIGRYYSAKDLGYYRRGADFAQMPVSAINGVLQKVTFPIMAKIQDDRSRLILVYRKYIKSTSLIIFIICAILIVMAKPIILLLLGKKWLNSVIYLQLFGISYMFDHISSINLNLLKVIGRSDLLLKLEILKKSLSILMLICAVPFGIFYICIALLVYSQIAIIINTYYTGKIFDLGYWTQIRDFSKYFVTSFISCIPAMILLHFHFNPLLFLIIGSIATLSCYFYLLRNDEMMMELLSVVPLLKNISLSLNKKE